MEKRKRATPRQLAEGMAEQRRRMPTDIVEPKVDEALPGEGGGAGAVGSKELDCFEDDEGDGGGGDSRREGRSGGGSDRSG
ncbi:uncharacterized protein A4U43_C04F7270 [Asparagus officinalis]|uniref:Uncharacterized protein n=1 Tax=Asparagus officinalis TaxID=4686 RepID=A0A5P1EZE5_ASPOF|nr:uncharacterized protein A4U43_C04F7270 [Asparagus officinalis]